MAPKSKHEAQNPLILRSHRLIEAFTKSDDERDFYLDRQEGFIVYVDLEKPMNDIEMLEEELQKNRERYCMIPKLTFFETKKIMEGFVNEKVYDIDTKEKLLDVIQSKEARENFLEFIYDHHSELEKWQQYYQERSRIRIIEWLRNNHFHFVFEEDLDLTKAVIEKVKKHLFDSKVSKEIAIARKTLVIKAKTYYSNEALNPRPKRGRPPKQAIKQEVEPQITTDIYTTVPSVVRMFLFTPEYTSTSAITFSSKFENEEQLLASKKHTVYSDDDLSPQSINQKLAELRNISKKWVHSDEEESISVGKTKSMAFDDFEDSDEDDEYEDEDFEENEEAEKFPPKRKKIISTKRQAQQPTKKQVPVSPKKGKQKPVPKPSKTMKKLPPKVKLIPKEKPSGKIKQKILAKKK